MNRISFSLLLILLVCSRVLLHAQAQLIVHTGKQGPRIGPVMYGLFFEEINHAGDGGLYAEMIRNRSYEESERPNYWELISEGSRKGSYKVEKLTGQTEFNTRALRVDIPSGGTGAVGIASEGYWGIAVREQEKYGFSFSAHSSGNFSGSLVVSLENVSGKILASGKIENISSGWKKYELLLTANATDAHTRLVIKTASPGTLWFDMVSLFPQRTFKSRSNGLRYDLASMLTGLHPMFVRFPGGCWVEGDTLPLAYRWKQTVGPIAERRTQYNIWQYYSTHGLGYHEYLQMCEDLEAEPLFVINCGMSHRGVVPLDQMNEWVQDALDAIEYANGPTDSKWGAMRTRNGHPKPFNLKYLEIGNENGGPAYRDRYALFHEAIKAKYPDVHLIANVWGGYPKNRPIEIIDEHYYSNPNFFIRNASLYDSYDRSGPKVYVGEYAVTSGCGTGNLRAALGEAAFMTGMERNSDVVVMASYAPLFANVNYKKWNPDLINFNNTTVYGTPSYYVQKIFRENLGDVVVPMEIRQQNLPPDPLPERNGKIGVGTWNTQSEYKDIKVTIGDKVVYQSDFVKSAKEWRSLSGDWKVHEGAYQQLSNSNDVHSVAGETSWKDYTITLKARKLGGAEGFLILFSVKDDDTWAWWNIAGWGNTQHAIEVSEKGEKSLLGKGVQGSIETGRWHDVKINVQGQTVQCYLDGTLIHDVKYEQQQVQPLHAVVTRDEAQHELILKVVNVSGKPILTQLQLADAEKVIPQGSVITLTSESGTDENSLEYPEKIIPKTTTLEYISKNFTYPFPANSVTIMRIKVEKFTEE
ncbi:MAG: alpha-L-arabinofuranosidase C-terminal domain-containing protein [bacterium]